MDKVTTLLLILTVGNLFIACSVAPKKEKEEDKTQIIPVKKEFLTYAEIIKFARNVQPVEPSKIVGAPFDKLQYDRVIAYYMDDQSREMPTVYNMDKKEFCKNLKKQAVLSQDQVDILTSTLTRGTSYGNVTAACFEPKLGVVFYLNDKVKMAIDICLDCNYLRSSLAIPAENSNNLVREDGSKILRNGFSKPAQVMIIDLSRELGLFYGSFQLKNFGNR